MLGAMGKSQDTSWMSQAPLFTSFWLSGVFLLAVPCAPIVALECHLYVLALSAITPMEALPPEHRTSHDHFLAFRYLSTLVGPAVKAPAALAMFCPMQDVFATGHCNIRAFLITLADYLARRRV